MFKNGRKSGEKRNNVAVDLEGRLEENMAEFEKVAKFYGELQRYTMVYESMSRQHIYFMSKPLNQVLQSTAAFSVSPATRNFSPNPNPPPNELTARLLEKATPPFCCTSYKRRNPSS